MLTIRHNHATDFQLPSLSSRHIVTFPFFRILNLFVCLVVKTVAVSFFFLDFFAGGGGGIELHKHKLVCFFLFLRVLLFSLLYLRKSITLNITAQYSNININIEQDRSLHGCDGATVARFPVHIAS